jgi:hypothetical protein
VNNSTVENAKLNRNILLFSYLAKYTARQRLFQIELQNQNQTIGNTALTGASRR